MRAWHCAATTTVMVIFDHAVSLTNRRDVIKNFEIQFVNVNTILTHDFNQVTVEPDDPGITPLPPNETAESRTKDPTIMVLKSSCPKTTKPWNIWQTTLREAA